MNRSRFHEILHRNQESSMNIVKKPNIVFYIKPCEKNAKHLSLAKGGNFGFEERDKVDILYDVSYSYFHLSAYPSSMEEKDENIHLSEIYVGDYQENNIYVANPLFSSSSSIEFES